MRASRLLHEWRKSQGINAGTAAARLGISGSALSEYERGKRTPRITVALQIAERTGGAVPIDSWGAVPMPEESGALPLDASSGTGTDDG